MKVENNFNQYSVNNVGDITSRHNHQNDREVADSLVDTGVSMEISQRGFALAGEMEPFLDTYETTCTLLKGTGHIGSEKMMKGDFADVLAENYQNELTKKEFLHENGVTRENMNSITVKKTQQIDVIFNLLCFVFLVVHIPKAQR